MVVALSKHHSGRRLFFQRILGDMFNNFLRKNKTMCFSFICLFEINCSTLLFFAHLSFFMGWEYRSVNL